MVAFSAFLESPKNVSFESQEKGELIIFLLRRHWITNVPWILFSFVLLSFPLLYRVILSNDSFFSLLPSKYALVAGLIWYLFTFLFILENYLIWYFNVYILTDKRVIDMDFYGIIHKKVSETPLRNIEDSTYFVSGIFPTLFDFGNIKIQTAAESPEFEFEQVPNPAQVHDRINDLITDIHKTRGRTKSGSK
ncbi:PH domain-containing protein [Candidatus Parcubacteria bacterium]|nr:PH domain-containing protein [Patescibacteria group bacterium]MCG2689557.1 PH domain-containing protein [Candidatus Parcubacteria bacterium]